MRISKFIQTIFISVLVLIFSCNNGENKDKKNTSQNHQVSQNKSLCDSIKNLKDYTPLVDAPIKKNSTFKVLRMLNFNEGKWFAVLDCDQNVYLDSTFLLKKGMYLMNDLNVLKKMQIDWEVKYIGADCCTPDMNIYFFKNGKLFYESGILKGNEGFQNGVYGWTPVKKNGIIGQYLKTFTLCK
ncbi:MAG: hypothetical protein V2A54_16650 [Bacteroidota bacterium]